MAPNSRSKKPRTDVSTSRPPTGVGGTRDLARVSFRDDDQKRRFNLLKGTTIIPTRFIGHATLKKIGIHKEVRTLFQDVGILSMFDMHHGTYKFLVLEFFSSLQLHHVSEGQTNLTFRLLNKERELTQSQLADWFGLPNTGIDFVGGHNEYDAKPIWFALTGRVVKDLTKPSITHVHSPVIRVWLKFMAFTLACASGNDKTTTCSLQILAGLLRPQEKSQTHLPRLLMQGWATIANVDNHPVQCIQCGGLVTHLATRYLWSEPAPSVPDLTWLDWDHLRPWFKPDKNTPLRNQHVYKLKDRSDTFPLPIKELPSLAPNNPTYLYPLPPTSNGASTSTSAPVSHPPHTILPSPLVVSQVSLPPSSDHAGILQAINALGATLSAQISSQMSGIHSSIAQLHTRVSALECLVGPSGQGGGVAQNPGLGEGDSESESEGSGDSSANDDEDYDE